MPKRRSRRQRYAEQPSDALPVAQYVGQRSTRPGRGRRTSWTRKRPTVITYGVIGLIVLGVVALAVSSIRGSFASDFEFTMYHGDVGVAADGAKFSELFPSDKPVVLNFWAGLCPPCRAEMPGFQRVYEEYKDQIVMLGLDVGPYMNLGSRRDAQNLLNELGVTYPTAYAHNRDPVLQFGVSSMPTTVFLTPDGRVFRTQVGYLDEPGLERSIQNLLARS